LHRQRGGEGAQLGNGTDIEVLPLRQLALQLRPLQHEAVGVGGLVGESGRQLVDGRIDGGLVFIEREIHQRGSRGSRSRSEAIRLSWISAAPEAMPATMARWWWASSSPSLPASASGRCSTTNSATARSALTVAKRAALASGPAMMPRLRLSMMS